MISPLFQLVARFRKRTRKPRRPRLPNRAERLYLGAMRRWADGFRAAVREALPAELVRQDAIDVGPMKGLNRARLKIQKLTDELPLDQVGYSVYDHARVEAERLVGLKNADIALAGQVHQWQRENVSLIKDMTNESLDRIQDLLDQYEGMRVEDLADEIESEFGVTRARAELIARDQTLKLNADLAKTAQVSAGVTQYRWSTSQDGSVRPDHADLEGSIYSWDDPPVTNAHEVDKGKEERRNHPGQDYQCRCVAIPVLEEYDEPKEVQGEEDEPKEGRGDGDWNEEAHPRAPAGTAEGGQFTSGGGGTESATHDVMFRENDRLQKAAKGFFGRDLTHQDVKNLTQVHNLNIPGAHSIEYEASPHGLDGISYQARVRDKDGKTLLFTKHQLETSWESGHKEIEAHHDLITVSKDLQGSGVGSALFDRQLREFQRMGNIDRITLEAAWIGTYQWPRLGFSLGHEKDFAALKGELVGWLKEKGVRLPEQALGKVKSAYDLARLEVKEPVSVSVGSRTVETRGIGKAFLVARGQDESKVPLSMKFELGSKSKELKCYEKSRKSR